LLGSDLKPFLKSGVTLAALVVGYIPVRIDFETMEVGELKAIFNNLLGILSRPVAFFKSIFDKRLKTVPL